MLPALLVGLLCAQVAAETADKAPVAAKDNAALTYWRAFAMIPEATDEKDAILVAPTIASPVAEQVEEYAAEWAPALKLLHEAASMEHCDWGIDYSRDGFETVLPHLANARKLARGGCFRARYYFAKGEPQKAAEDLAAVVRLARHAGFNGRDILINTLVQIAIENLVLDTATRNADAPAAEAALKSALAPLALKGDESIAKQTILAEKAVFLTISSGAAGAYYDEAARMQDLPADQFEKAYADLEAKIKAGNDPMLLQVLPAFRRIREQVESLNEKWATLVEKVGS